MGKFAVFSGFLGSGKTTTMMKLAQKGGKTAMITNDLGSPGLADHKLARPRGCTAAEVSGDCICYQTGKLMEKLDELFEKQGCELVISDIPGFGVGALDHVYHTLSEQHPGKYELAPFTVLVEPKTVRLLEAGGSDLAYILHTQLVEADLIVLNKCDLLTETERNSALSYLKNRYPQAQVLSVSAGTGEGLEALHAALMTGAASMHRPDTGYGGALQPAGEARMTLISAMREVILLANAEGVALNEGDLMEYLDILSTFPDDATPSMGQDRINRRPSEVELFAGTVRRLAAGHGLPVPANDFLYRRVHEIEAEY